MVFCARSRTAAIFAKDNPALRSEGLRTRSTSCGLGQRPFAPSAAMRPKITLAALPEML